MIPYSVWEGLKEDLTHTREYSAYNTHYGHLTYSRGDFIDRSHLTPYTKRLAFERAISYWEWRQLVYPGVEDDDIRPSSGG